jgi:hypothetical protein
LSVVLLVLALAWTGAAIWSIMQGSPALTLPNVLQWVGFISPPLILMAVAWLLLGQTLAGRRRGSRAPSKRCEPKAPHSKAC